MNAPRPPLHQHNQIYIAKISASQPSISQIKCNSQGLGVLAEADTQSARHKKSVVGSVSM